MLFDLWNSIHPSVFHHTVFGSLRISLLPIYWLEFLPAPPPRGEYGAEQHRGPAGGTRPEVGIGCAGSLGRKVKGLLNDGGILSVRGATFISGFPYKQRGGGSVRGEYIYF